MGNCIGEAFSQNEEDEKSKFWEADEKLSSGAPFSKLRKRWFTLSEMEEMGCLMRKGSSNGLKTPSGVVKRVKIMVNKKQWKRLMGSEEEIQLRNMMLQSLVRRARKWRPSLASIPEL